VRQLVTEGVLLALPSGAGGGIVAVWATDLVVAYFAMTVGLELLRPDYLMDWRVFGFIASPTTAPGCSPCSPDSRRCLRSTRIELAPRHGRAERANGETPSTSRFTAEQPVRCWIDRLAELGVIGRGGCPPGRAPANSTTLGRVPFHKWRSDRRHNRR
jgi:hypothetical protein